MEISVPSLLRIKPNALHKIGKYLRDCGFTEIAILYGEGVKEMFFPILEISFASSEIKVLYEETVGTNNLDDAFQTAKNISSRIKAIVALGGGKAIDYCKYIGLITQLPVISVPTLISNDGFCSPFSSMLVNGKRKTVKTKIPDGVIVDTQIIQKIPAKFIYSGMGDLFCKITSVFDWKLAYKKTGETVNDFAAIICTNAVDTFKYYQNKEIANLEYLGILISSLLMTGIAMEIAMSSRPASGSEHLISHAYDRIAKKPSIHGLQVGVASYAVSYLQEITHETVKTIVQESGFLQQMTETRLDKKEFLLAIQHAPEIKENYYTILSEKNNISRLIEFVESDPLMKKMVR